MSLSCVTVVIVIYLRVFFLPRMGRTNGLFSLHLISLLTFRVSLRQMARNLFVGVFLATIALTLSADNMSSRTQIALSIDDIRSPIFSAKGVKVKFTGEKLSQLWFHLGEVVIQERVWRDIQLICDQFKLTDRSIDCDAGVLHLPNSVPLPVIFRYSSLENAFNVEIKPTEDERWQLAMHWDEDAWRNELTVVSGQMARITQWLPNKEAVPFLSKGTVNGAVKINGNTGGVVDIESTLLVNELTFSDSSGLHAGENVNVTVKLNATHHPHDDQWQWQSELNWQHGEVFWQPLYLKGKGHRLSLEGAVSEENIYIRSGHLKFVDIGVFNFSGVAARQNYEIIDFNLETSSLELVVLFDQVINPFLGNTAFADLQVTGQGDLAWRYRDGDHESLLIDLYDVSVVDQRKRFAFNRVNGHVPWHKENATIVDVSFLNGHVLQIPLGSVRVSLEVNDMDIKIPQLILPVLDGALELENFIATQQADGWRWQFSAELLPVSMEKLTDALQIQKMHGTLSGVIPAVNYKQSTVTFDGELSFNIFDGLVTAKELKLINPLGFAPHLEMDLGMRNLDLDLLTRTFSFGRMQGRIDMDMNNMELSSWRPIRFDAYLYSSPGNYPRRISQAAIENISALGGAGAAAAIQRSFMRFFEEFSYSEIGWRCVLRNNVCRMGGVEPDSQVSDEQGYAIVKGGGVPAITVMGYNRDVGWQEMINRLQRITEGNSPIIQ